MNGAECAIRMTFVGTLQPTNRITSLFALTRVVTIKPTTCTTSITLNTTATIALCMEHFGRAVTAVIDNITAGILQLVWISDILYTRLHEDLILPAVKGTVFSFSSESEH